MDYFNLYSDIQSAKERIEYQFKDVPIRSPKTSIMASHARWRSYGPMITQAFQRMKRIAGNVRKVKEAEYARVQNALREIESEIEEIRRKLDECALTSEVPAPPALVPWPEPLTDKPIEPAQ